MKSFNQDNGRRRRASWLAFAAVAIWLSGSAPAAVEPAKPEFNAAYARWFTPQDWQRDSETPVLGLGEKGRFDDQHIFAPHVIRMEGEFWMYYSGSQRCVDAGTYKGVAKDPEHPEKSDQRLFKLGLARSKDGIHFTRHSKDPVFSFGDDIHSVVTAALLKNPDGSVHREKGRLRMYFAAVDFPHGTYKHDLYETTSTDGCYWSDDKHTALGFAVSKDGLNWTKHPDNPMFRPEPKNDWESNFTTSQTLMRLPDGSFRLWYAGRRQPPWSNLYFAIGTAHWAGPGK